MSWPKLLLAGLWWNSVVKTGSWSMGRAREALGEASQGQQGLWVPVSYSRAGMGVHGMAAKKWGQWLGLFDLPNV